MDYGPFTSYIKINVHGKVSWRYFMCVCVCVCEGLSGGRSHLLIKPSIVLRYSVKLSLLTGKLVDNKYLPRYTALQAVAGAISSS
jgi:hypothetical protein